MSFIGYMLTKLARSLCCCLRSCIKSYDKRLVSLQNIEKSRDMLSAEKDIEEFINLRRMSHFLIKVLLKRHQWSSVPYFKRYVIQTKHLQRDQISKALSETQLTEALDLDGDRIDRLILHEVSRRVVHGFDRDPNLSASSSEEEQED